MAMPSIVFNIHLFRTPDDRPRSQRVLLWLMEALTQANLLWLREHPDAPLLYSTDVTYLAETGEEWRDIPTLLEIGNGDCEDLACWRAAELRKAGINARPYIKWRKEGASYIYHATVRHPDGKIEDAALAMGMVDGRMFRKPMFVGD